MPLSFLFDQTSRFGGQRQRWLKIAGTVVDGQEFNIFILTLKTYPPGLNP
jgi:hypothetical protein